MQLISKVDNGFRFLLWVIDIYSRDACIATLKDKKAALITNTSKKILNKSNYKPNKIQVDQESEFYNRSMKSWLEDYDTEMHSTHIEGKSVVAERFIRTLKKKDL